MLDSPDKKHLLTTAEQPSESSSAVLEARNISQLYHQNKGLFKSKTPFYAVRDVSFSLHKGKTLGLIGESGCGKSTVAKIASGLMQPSAGEVYICGASLYDAKNPRYTQYRKDVCKHLQMIFQDPHASLNPRMTIAESVGEPLYCLYPEVSSSERKKAVFAILDDVGISADQANKHPHAFSGGQRQRIAIARALIIKPHVLLCDEPTSSLDSSVQAQVLNLLSTMQNRLSLSCLFISHDLAVVRHMSDDVAVMYAGTIVEQGPIETVFNTPGHPYTRLLFASVPGESTSLHEKKTVQNHTGQLPQKSELPPPPTETARKLNTASCIENNQHSCPFAGRCPLVREECHAMMPELNALHHAPAHLVRCPYARG